MNVRSLCLAILYFGESTGYEIRKQAQEGVFSYFIEASYGAIYPALSKLTDEGLVSFREEIQSGRPNKKVYTLTPAGKAAFIEALSGEPVQDKLKSEFLLMMMCSELLEPERVELLIDEHLAVLEEKIRELKATYKDCLREGSRYALTCGIESYTLAAGHLRKYRKGLVAQAGNARDTAVPEPEGSNKNIVLETTR